MSGETVIKESDAILNDLFSSIGQGNAKTELEEDSEEDSEEESEEECEEGSSKRKKRRKKEKKKHKKHKKKHKKHKRDSRDLKDDGGDGEDENVYEVRSIRRIDEDHDVKIHHHHRHSRHEHHDEVRSHRRDHDETSSRRDRRYHGLDDARPGHFDSHHGDKKDRNKYDHERTSFQSDRRGANDHRHQDRHLSNHCHSDESRKHRRYDGEGYKGRRRDVYEHNNQHRQHGDYKHVRHDRPRSDSHRRSQESRPPVRKDDDIFWESTWDAMQLQEKADYRESRGQHFLTNRKRERTPTLSPSPVRANKRSPSPECEELKRLKELKAVQELVVKDSDKYVAEPLDPKLFEWDDKTKMWKRKVEKYPAGSYEEELRKRMEEQFREKEQREEQEQREQGKPKESSSQNEEEKTESSEQNHNEDLIKKVSSKQLTLDEIEEIRKKREKNQKQKKQEQDQQEQDQQEEQEDGEVKSDEEDQDEQSSRRRRSPRSRSASRSRRRSGERRYDYYRDSRENRSNSGRRYDGRYHSSSSRHYSPSRDFSRRRYRSPSPRYRRRYDRSRSRERDRGFRGSKSAIDKEKLLAIAKKNAVKLLSSDNLMGIDHSRLMAIKSGGQSLNQLTDFCRELAKKGITDDFDDETNEMLASSSDPDFHHPFEVKEKPLPTPYQSGAAGPGSSLGQSGIGLEMLTPAMKVAAKTHRMLEFPVSSGNAHRVKESTTQEEPEQKENNVESRDGDSDDNSRLSQTEEAKGEGPSEAEVINAQNPLGVLIFGGQIEPRQALEFEASKELESSQAQNESNESKEVSATESKADDSDDKVFSEVSEPTQDISSIVAQRLAAMKKLTNNPSDPEALKKMHDAQKEMTSWAASKNKPGQFTGHTGAKILSKTELSMGIQAWAKQEQFTSAKKVAGGFGEFMLKKMGWQEGEGLGKDRSGDIDPLTLDIKMDKKGLMAAEENTRKRKGGKDVLTLTACKDFSGKHPVSALMEVATKRRWGPPNFIQAFECGPSHKKQYIFKVTVDGVSYQPSVASDNKKKAKSDAATKALRCLGLLPNDPNNPL